VLQLDQPRLMGHENPIRELGGRVCMWNTVDIQWSVSETTSEAALEAEVSDMVRTYDVRKYQGGFIAKHYPSPWDIGLSVRRQRLIHRLFMQHGCTSLDR
jgi:hypothetical protein